MKQFTDSDGRDWHIKLTIGSVKRVKDVLGVDLLAIEDGKPPLLTKLAMDVMLLCDVIFILLKPQADERNIKDVTFGESLGGDVILAAHNAFFDELVLFSQGRHREDLVEAIQGHRALIEVGLTRAKTVIEKVGVKAKSDLLADIDKTEKRMLGETSTNSPDSAESTPAP